MRRSFHLRAALLVLALLLLLGGASGAVHADGPASDTASVGWVVSAKDGEDVDRVLSTAEEVAEKLGSGFALDFGASVSTPGVADLRRGGVKITPPAGYSVRSVFLVPEGGSPASGSRSLLSLASASTDGSGAVTLPAAIFAADFDASAVGSVFNGSGESYVLQIALDRLSAGGNVTLSYTPGALAASLGDAELVAGGNTVILSRGSGLYASGKAAALSAEVSSRALSESAKEFTGWKLTLPNAASALVSSGQSLSLSSSATLEAQWRDAIAFIFTGGEKLYDGEPLTGSYTQSGTLKEGDTLEAPEDAFTLSRTEAGNGEATLDLSRVRVMRGEQDVTGEYHFVVVPAPLRVIARGVTFRVTDVNCPYDGAAHAPSAFSLESGSLLSGHTAVPVFSGQQTVPGSSTGSARFTITDGDGSDVTKNYDISVINCTIEVSVRSEKQPLTVKISDTEKEYDGTSDVTAAYAIDSGSLLGSDRLVAGSVSGSITGVGSGTVNGSFAVFNGETDVSASYEITVVPGALTVKPRALVLTADSAEKDFDGTPLTKDSFTLSSGTLISGHSITATVSGSQTTAGSSPNKIDPASVKVMDGENDVTGLYSIRLVDGTLTVKGPAAVTTLTITMKDAEKVYDGKALTSKDFTLSSGTLAEGDTLVVTASGEQTDAGSSAVTATFVVKHGEADVTANYSITVTAGKLTVKPRPISIKAGSASKIYDGRALYASSYTISSGELVKGHKLKAEVSGSRTELGSSVNAVVRSSIKITDSAGKDVTANYEITTVNGTLTITSNPITSITLSVGDANKVYDGKPYRFLSSDVKVSAGTLPTGYHIEATFNPEAPTDVGKYEVTIKGVTIRDGSGADVTNRFNISRLKGTLTITERPLVIETKAANKAYDGTALTERSTPIISGRADGHQVTLRITGTQTKVGSSENTVSDVKITDKETGADVTKNYAISYQYGLLTVSESAENDGGEGGSYNWVNGSAGTLYIHFDHGYDGFEGLQVDGKDLDRSAYTSASGSTDIWLKASYLNTLSSGSHTLTAKYAGGEKLDTNFSVQGTQSTRSSNGSSRLVLCLVILATAFLACFAAIWYLLLGKELRWKK